MVPSLQSGVMGPCLVWGTGFPSHFPLEGTGSYPIYLGHNRWIAVPVLQDPDSSSGAFHQASGQGRSLNGRQNGYSYVTMSTAMGFGGEPMELDPEWS
jgi:hypothetical protein